MSVNSGTALSARIRLCVILASMLFPTFSWGIVWATSLMQSGHSLHCNISLGMSLADRNEVISAVLVADFAIIKAHHEKLNRMDDESFKQFMLHEVGQVAFCHPLASELIGGLPGKDYLSPLNTLTAAPSSIDRKVSYGIWAYSAMYRSLRQFIRDAEANIPSLPEWDQYRYREELASAKRLLKRFQGVPSDALASDGAGDQLTLWLKDEFRVASSQESSVNEAYSESGVAHKSGEGTKSEEVQLYSTKSLENGSLGSADILAAKVQKDSIGALRPTVSTYTFDGRKLVIHELQAVHLLFPSSLGPKNSCFDRYAPDYPMFARLMASGLGRPAETIELGRSEAAEVLKFFGSASRVEGVSAFMVSDTSAVAITKTRSPDALKRCLGLVEQTSSHAAHEKIVSGSGSANFNDDGYLSGRVVSFSAKDRIWQSLMAMLAAKRIEHSQLEK